MDTIDWLEPSCLERFEGGECGDCADRGVCIFWR